MNCYGDSYGGARGPDGAVVLEFVAPFSLMMCKVHYWKENDEDPRYVVSPGLLKCVSCNTDSTADGCLRFNGTYTLGTSWKLSV